jgi:GntR family transcriptional regulator
MHTAWAEDGEVLEVSESIWPADRGIVIDEYDVSDHAQTTPHSDDKTSYPA